MVNEYSVRYIVQTYDLPRNLETKLIYIASKTVEQTQLANFKDQYEYIAYLVEKFTRPRLPTAYFTVHHPTRLRALYGVDEHQSQENETTNQPQEAERVLRLLAYQLETPQFEFVERLVRKAGCNYVPDPVYVYANFDQVKDKLDELEKRFGDRGVIRLPARPIEHISFNPLAIAFKPRKYNGNPLQFFYKHWDVYAGLTRSELRSFDSGLYRALCRANEMDEAIPSTPCYKHGAYP